MQSLESIRPCAFRAALADAQPGAAAGGARIRPRPIRAALNPSDMARLAIIAGDLVAICPSPHRTSVDHETISPDNLSDNLQHSNIPSQDQLVASLASLSLSSPSPPPPKTPALQMLPALCVAWPSPATTKGHVQVSQAVLDTCNLLSGGLAYISLVTSPPAVAARAVLSWPTPPDFPIDLGLEIYLKELLLDLEYASAGMHMHFQYMHKQATCIISSLCAPDGAPSSPPQDQSSIVPFRITRSTKIVIDTRAIQKPVNKDGPATGKTSYASIGGLSAQIAAVRDLVEAPLLAPERFARFGLRPPRGVLLYGPPGTGKTLIARAVASETCAHVIIVNGPEIISRFYGETEARLRAIFDDAKERSPSIIFFDEIDALCPRHEDSTSDLEKRIVATLLTLMDGLDQTTSASSSTPRVVVLAATNRPNAIDDALRRPGRFDREIEIGIPSASDRLDILRALLSDIPNSLSNDNLREIADVAHGYVGADLAAVVREAGIKAIQRVSASMLTESHTHTKPDTQHLHSIASVPDELIAASDSLTITPEDLRSGLVMVQPSAMREITLEVPHVRWTDVGGQIEIKQRLQEAVEWPLKHPEAFTHFNIRPSKGILLYGPPGCSKTLMAKALATEAGLNFLAVKGPEVFSKWVGESEKAVREVFRKARAASPSIIFFDEIDALAVRRSGSGGESSVADRVLSQLLSEMDGIEALVNVTVVAATNRPDILDSALLRPGRIDSILYVAPPDLASRRDILRIQMKNMACHEDVDLEVIADMMDGYSGAEVVAVCQEAAMLAMEEDLNAPNVAHRHFIQGAKSITPRITPEMIRFYDDFRTRSGLRSV